MTRCIYQSLLIAFFAHVGGFGAATVVIGTLQNGLQTRSGETRRILDNFSCLMIYETFLPPFSRVHIGRL